MCIEELVLQDNAPPSGSWENDIFSVHWRGVL